MQGLEWTAWSGSWSVTRTNHQTILLNVTAGNSLTDVLFGVYNPRYRSLSSTCMAILTGKISVVVYHTPSERASMTIPPKSSIVPARPFCRYPTAMAFLSIIATSIRTISHPDLSLDSAFHTPHSNILV